MKTQLPAADDLIGRTLASDVLHRLRGDIVAARIAPGERLRFEALRTTYGVSFSTLREALAHLVQENLVVAEGQRGFRVAPVTRFELIDVTQTRVFVERELLRLAVLHAPASWGTELTELNDALEAASVDYIAGARLDPAWQAAHQAFHDALVAPAGSPTLLALRAMLNRRSMRYRSWARRLHPGLPSGNVPHRPLLEAAVARDALSLMDAAETHIRSTGNAILQYAAEALVAA